MIKKIVTLTIILSIILLFTFSVSAQKQTSSSTSDWEYFMYSNYDVDSFKSYAPANGSIDFDNVNYKLLNAAIFYETNRMRIEHNKVPFKHSIALEKAAFMHSEDMVKDSFFDHINYKDKSKYTPSDRMEMFGVDSGYRGENIATVFGIQYKSGTMVSSFDEIPPHSYNSCAEAVVDTWMHSPGHRANILDDDFIYLGCGAYYYYERLPTFTATQNFGTEVPE